VEIADVGQRRNGLCLDLRVGGVSCQVQERVLVQNSYKFDS
jgi:hypothetical protein